MSTDRYDVVIYDVRTGVVKSLAGINLPLEDAALHFDTTAPFLQPHLYVHPVPASTALKGSVITEMFEGRQRRIDALERLPRRKIMQYPNPQRRRENSVCIVCESPALATAIHCAKCAVKANADTSRRNRPKL